MTLWKQKLSPEVFGVIYWPVIRSDKCCVRKAKEKSQECLEQSSAQKASKMDTIPSFFPAAPYTHPKKIA